MNCQQTQKLVNAYHDGELDIVTSVQLDEHLQDCPHCAALKGELSALSGVLRNDALRFQAPPDLRQTIRAAAAQAAKTESDITRRVPWFHRAGWATAAVMAFSALILAFQIPRNRGGDRMIADLASSHIRSLMANHLTDVASTDQHTVKPWFDGKLDFAPPVKDLRAQGFPLIGGRLDFIDGHSAAALVYGRQKHFINLFIWPGKLSGPGASPALETNGYHVVGWSDSGMVFWAVSDLSESELKAFVKLWFAG